MNWIEILLIIVGVVAFVGSFLIKGKADKENEPIQVDPEIIKDMVNKEMEEAKERVSEVVDETLQYAVEKTERASERISNEKIMAINEYSDTVLADINKSHQEVMFLYDMLNDKHENIKETVKQVDKSTKEAREVSMEISREISQQELSHETSKDKETLAESTKNDDKFEVFNFVEQLPHIARNEVAVVQPELVQSIPVQPAITQPEPVVAPVMPLEKILDTIEEPIPLLDNGDNNDDTEPVQPENNNDRILEMHKAGIDNVEIAKELGLGVGEVKLVINLFKGAI